ncbi:MAG TPA: NAD-dependent epimerase/dehydratase family protein [Fimbriimonadaceae bacterium]|nr:NAD-dependent epimerase/dehydratase family protein [Fimbriimonadaceae bacterium]
MKILVIGGTAFVGRHIVEVALRKGHELTLFNRGKRNPSLFPDVEKLIGDRYDDLHLLDHRHWDAVIDTSGYVPRVVQASAQKLHDCADHYCFISTISVYSDVGATGPTEDSKVGALQDETVEEITGETYGPLKVLCEEEVRAAFPDDALIIRPGLIVGPYDHTDRFTYWPLRFHRGGRILAPDRKEQPVQFIDARDLAEWTVSMVEGEVTGTYNAVGPSSPMSFGEFIACCSTTVGNPQAEVVWTPTPVLQAQGVSPWTDLPLVLPYDGSEDGMALVVNEHAVENGLTLRPVEDTIRDTLEWALTRGEHEMKAGLLPEREAEVLSSI